MRALGPLLLLTKSRHSAILKIDISSIDITINEGGTE